MPDVANKARIRFVEIKDRMWACYHEGNMFVLEQSAMVDDHEVQRFLDMAEGLGESIRDGSPLEGLTGPLELVEDFGFSNKFFVGQEARCRRWLTA